MKEIKYHPYKDYCKANGIISRPPTLSESAMGAALVSPQATRRVSLPIIITTQEYSQVIVYDANNMAAANM